MQMEDKDMLANTCSLLGQDLICYVREWNFSDLYSVICNVAQYFQLSWVRVGIKSSFTLCQAGLKVWKFWAEEKLPVIRLSTFMTA